MFCNKCGTEINISQKFCPKCGKRIVKENIQNSSYTCKKYSISNNGKIKGYVICALGFLYLICIGVFIGLSDDLDDTYKFALAAMCLGDVYLIMIGAFMQRTFICINDDKIIMNQGSVLGQNIEFTYNEIFNIIVFKNSISFDTLKGKIKIKNIENATECVDLIKNRMQEK